MNEFKKLTEDPVSTRQETQTSRAINGSELTYTLCDRTDLNSSTTNYFVSFNLPYTSTDFPTTSQLSLSKPELQQLNVDKMVITPIAKENYNEILDGRSITFTVPHTNPNPTHFCKHVDYGTQKP